MSEEWFTLRDASFLGAGLVIGGLLGGSVAPIAGIIAGGVVIMIGDLDAMR